MRNHDVAELLERLSLLSEASGEDRFKAIAYRRAATSIKNLGEDVDEVRKRGELTQIQYIGEGIAKKIDEYLRTGKLEFMERLEKDVPEGTLELMQVSGDVYKRQLTICAELATPEFCSPKAMAPWVRSTLSRSW